MYYILHVSRTGAAASRGLAQATASNVDALTAAGPFASADPQYASVISTMNVAPPAEFAADPGSLQYAVTTSGVGADGSTSVSQQVAGAGMQLVTPQAHQTALELPAQGWALGEPMQQPPATTGSDMGAAEQIASLGSTIPQTAVQQPGLMGGTQVAGPTPLAPLPAAMYQGSAYTQMLGQYDLAVGAWVKGRSVDSRHRKMSCPWKL